VTHWLLIRGRGDRPLDSIIERDQLRAHSSSKRPSVEPGELAVLYAAVWQAIFAVVEIAGPPEHDPTRTRWSWRFPIRPLVAVGDLHDAPAVEEAGIFPQSLWRHSHIRLTDDQFATARRLIEETARPGAVLESGEAQGRTARARHRLTMPH
jgi:hypothetical protein